MRGKNINNLKIEEIKEIKWLERNTNLNDEEIATYFDVQRSTIYLIRSKRAYKDIETPIEKQDYFKVQLPKIKATTMQFVFNT